MVFGRESVAGTYAVSISGHGGRAPFAALGMYRFDGAGSFDGFLLENRQGERYGDRSLTRVNLGGRYDIEPNGLGTLRGDAAGDLIAHLAVRADPNEGVVPELGLILRDLDDSTGALRTGVLTRLPDGATFNTGSLAGNYVGMVSGLGGQVTAAGFGFIRYDGTGHFEERNVANVQGDSFRSRRFVPGADQGSYAVEADGTGRVADGAVRFVITRAETRGGVTIALAYSFFVAELVPATAAHFTGTVTRIGD